MPFPVLREWPVEDRPREKLATRGERALTDSELLAILLRTGRRGVTAVDLARSILERFRSFRNMADLDPSEWDRIPGVGRAKSAAIRAALEIARRLPEQPSDRAAPVRGPDDVAARWGLRLRDRKKEVFFALFLDAARRVLEEADISAGTVGEVPVYPREVFHRALRAQAASVIAIHNHPSGDPTPSPQDESLTDHLVFSGGVLGIPLSDHVILGDGRRYSFLESGRIDNARRAFDRWRANAPSL